MKTTSKKQRKICFHPHNPDKQNKLVIWIFPNFLHACHLQELIKGRLQIKYKFVLKAAFLYADIPAKTIFSEKFMF